MKDAFAVFDGLARPVADVLVKPGQQVEQGGFAHVGLAGQGDGEHFFGQQHAGMGVLCLEYGRSSCLAPLNDGFLASSRPKATIVPRNETTSGPCP